MQPEWLIVTLDGQNPETGPRKKLASVLDFACGSGSLLLNIRHRVVNAGGAYPHKTA
jgi:type I restriction enzyme M protein